MPRVALAFSGGLDTTFCAVWLREERGLDVVTVTVDTGGLDDAGRSAIAARSAACGAERHVLADGRARVFDRFVTYLVKGNVLRGGVYPLCVGAERVVQAEEIARVAREIDAGAVAHGSTGAGNDGVRFDVAFAVRLPGVEIITPIRDLGLTREASEAYLRERGIPVEARMRDYSFNVGLWGTTIGGRETHDAWAEPPAAAFRTTADPTTAPPAGEELILRFEQGIPVAIDGDRLAGVPLVERLNEVGSRHGVGRGIHVGDTILGIKGRLAFEAPAPLVLIRAHQEIEKLVLSPRQALWKQRLGDTWGSLLHEGLFDDPLARDVEAFLDRSQELVTGDVRVRLRQGRIEVVGARSPYSLLGAEGARYGETAGWTGEEARAFARLYGLSTVHAARRRRSEPEDTP